MANLITIENFSSRFSPNLLSKGAVFEDTAMTVNITSGTGGISTGLEPKENASFNVLYTSFQTTDLSFNFGDELESNATGDGNYIFQMAIKDTLMGANTFLPFDFEVLIYKDGVHTDTLEGTFDFDSSIYSGQWVVYSQLFPVSSVNTLDFSFKIKHNPTAPVSNNSFNIGMLKVEKDDRFLGIPSAYTLPFGLFSSSNDLHIAETQWNVTDIGPQVIANGASINLLTLINNATDKNVANSDEYDQLDIVSNSIKTTYRGCKIIHTIRVSFNISAGTDQFYQLQIRRTVDDSVVYRKMLQRNADETIQTEEMTTRTLSLTDPFVVDGFYLAFVNNSGASATIDDALSVLVISHYQKSQPQ